jgi:hypothetical protein
MQHVGATPFFYEDSHHVFYVTTDKSWLRGNGYGSAQSFSKAEIPQLIPQKGYGPPILDQYAQILQRAGGQDPLILQSNHITKQIAIDGTVHFGSKEIGTFGNVPDRVTQKL